LKDTQLTPNDSEAAVKIQEVCTNLEGLVGKIDALETGFTDLVERSRTSSSSVPPFPTEITSSSQCSSHPNGPHRRAFPVGVLSDVVDIVTLMLGHF
jgi:hypothetical protein